MRTFSSLGTLAWLKVREMSVRHLMNLGVERKDCNPKEDYYILMGSY
jgi:hypothetical protein